MGSSQSKGKGRARSASRRPRRKSTGLTASKVPTSLTALTNQIIKPAAAPLAVLTGAVADKNINFTLPSAGANWEVTKNNFNQQKQLLDSQTSDSIIENTVSAMNRSIANYVQRAGISSSETTGNDVDYDTALKYFDALQTLQDNYIQLNADLTAQITSLVNSSDLQAKLKQVSELKASIAKLEKALEEAKQDSDIAHSRQNSVEEAKKDTSYYQGFGAILGFSKPLKNISIPFLIGFGILSFFFGGLLLKEFLSTSTKSLAASGSEGLIGGLFTDKRFLAALGGVVFTIVLVTILSATGRLGKVI
jgi:hypothetical protein